MPPMTFNRPDSSRLLTPLKILKEGNLTPSEIGKIEIQRTFPIDARDLQTLYFGSDREVTASKHRNREYVRYCINQIEAAYVAAKLGEEVTSITIWTDERSQV